MTNFNKTSGFITLTVVLIIVLLITGLTLMTGKMLMSEQRTASNQVRYHEATNAAQMGIDKAVAQLMASFANRSAISSAEAPYYKVSFGDVSEITIGSTTLKSMVITSEGTSGYSADSESPDDAGPGADLRPVPPRVPRAAHRPGDKHHVDVRRKL